MLVKVEYMFHGLCVEAKRRKIKAEIALALALVQKLEKKLNVQIQIIAFFKKFGCFGSIYIYLLPLGILISVT